MRRLLTIIFGMACLVSFEGASAQTCTREDFAKAVNDAGVALRQLNAENAPRLQAKMRQLKTKMNWPDAGFEEKAYQALQDERIAALDAEANDRLARIDALGTIGPSAEPDCAKLQDLSAASLELRATVKAKSNYMFSKLDQMLGEAPAAAQPKPKSAEIKPVSPPPPKPAPPAKTEPKVELSAKLEPPSKAERSAKTTPDSSRDVAIAPPAPAPGPPPASTHDQATTPETDGYTIDEIRAASAGFFGQMSANLGSVIEHVFRKSGRPTGYILGTEGGGAFLAGVRYGKGTLYLRSGGTQQVFWHGPSLGLDVGGEGSKTLFLIYKMTAPEQLYSSFTGVDGSAYLVGGVGATLVTNGTVIMAPIRSGLGLRLGANIGYIRFTPKATWNPF
ncbi:MAG TPA: DUF1134 domain-containing protein [Hyphomicrobiaceae bacterium]|nr:DUF1134 domain-containing protein [Hyphomicrobiaceae bacterium]